MRFTTNDYIIDSINPQIGIPLGCTVSPVLFVLALELIERSPEDAGESVEIAPGHNLPAIRSFMDDLNLSNSLPQISAAIPSVDRVGMYGIQGQEIKKFSPEEGKNPEAHHPPVW